MRAFRVLVPLLAFALLACGEESPLHRMDPDGGYHGNGNGNGNKDKAGLVINAALGIDVNDFALSNETLVEGLIGVELDGEEAPEGTTVTLNGKPLIPSWMSGFFEVDPENVPEVGAGDTIELVATSGGLTSSISFACPPDPGWSQSPAAGSTLSEGQTVTASWTADIYYNRELMLILQPYLTIRPYDSAKNRASGYPSGEQRADPVSPAKSASVKAPSAGGDDGYLLELVIFGKYETKPNGQGGENVGVCGLVKRAKYTAAE